MHYSFVASCSLTLNVISGFFLKRFVNFLLLMKHMTCLYSGLHLFGSRSMRNSDYDMRFSREAVILANG